jgi:hypothetical protein
MVMRHPDKLSGGAACLSPILPNLPARCPTRFTHGDKAVRTLVAVKDKRGLLDIF